MSLRDDVLTTVEVISEEPNRSDQIVVERLVEEGYDIFHAELLTVFVPLGLGRALIERMRFRPAVQLSDKVIVLGLTSDERRAVNLSQVPEFQVALHLGRETFQTGIIPREQFSAASSIGVEMKLINQILNSGNEVEGSVIAAPVLVRLAKAPGFEAWYHRLMEST